MGKDAELKPIILEGKVNSVQVTGGGSDYSSAPDIEIRGDGVGAKARAVVSNGKIISVVVLNGGVGYTQDNTTIAVTNVGLLQFSD